MPEHKESKTSFTQHFVSKSLLPPARGLQRSCRFSFDQAVLVGSPSRWFNDRCGRIAGISMHTISRDPYCPGGMTLDYCAEYSVEFLNDAGDCIETVHNINDWELVPVSEYAATSRIYPVYP